jgi:hypothetical protein
VQKSDDNIREDHTVSSLRKEVSAMRQKPYATVLLILLTYLLIPSFIQGRDLSEIKQDGILRHLGVNYAAFVSGSGDGLDVEIMQGFASFIGVQYQFIGSSWNTIFGDLTGNHVQKGLHGAKVLNTTPITGDVIASGITILPWRQEVVNFSHPTFPTSVWLISSSESDLQPIIPTGSLDKDINQVKSILKDHSVLTKKNTCLAPELYNLSATGADIRYSNGRFKLNELAFAVINQEADATLLDVPDALIALQKWPGKIKVIGPVSQEQRMGACFRKNSPQLLKAFNIYLEQIKKDGSYASLVKKYYPSVFLYYSDFFVR